MVPRPPCLRRRVSRPVASALFLPFSGRTWAVNLRGLVAETITGTKRALRPLIVTILKTLIVAPPVRIVSGREPVGGPWEGVVAGGGPVGAPPGIVPAAEVIARAPFSPPTAACWASNAASACQFSVASAPSAGWL